MEAAFKPLHIFHYKEINWMALVQRLQKSGVNKRKLVAWIVFCDRAIGLTEALARRSTDEALWAKLRAPKSVQVLKRKLVNVHYVRVMLTRAVMVIRSHTVVFTIKRKPDFETSPFEPNIEPPGPTEKAQQQFTCPCS